MRKVSLVLNAAAALLAAAGASADGPTALQLQATLAAGATSPQSSQSVSVAGTDISATVSTARGATTPRIMAVWQAERASVMDYGVKGGGFQAYAIQPQNAGDKIVWLANHAAIAAGKFATSNVLPVGTRIVSFGSPVATTQVFATGAASAPLSSASLGTALSFNGRFFIPAGAAVSGAGVPAGATVIRCDSSSTGTAVYLSVPTTSGVAAATPINFTYAAVPVTLSSGWSSAVAAGAPVGIAVADDGPALQQAFNQADAANGGPGSIQIPAGVYYATNYPASSDGLAVETGANVVFLSGSSPVAAFKGYGPGFAARTLASTAQNPLATTLNINQTLFQQTVPTAQVQGVMISQTNVGCINDGSPYGCGMVGQDIQQSMYPSIMSGVMWGYHVTDYIGPGQRIAWSGAEIELNNQSGVDEPRMSGSATTNGIHLDDIGSTPLTMGIYFGGNIAGNAYWHTAMGCPDNAVKDYCVQVITGPASTVLAGLDMKGNITGQTIQAAGSVISTRSGSYTIAQSDCGTTIRSLATGPVTYTIPASLMVGCKLDVVQAGSGAVLFAAGAGGSLEAFQAASQTAGPFAKASVMVDTSSSFLLSGQVQ